MKIKEIDHKSISSDGKVYYDIVLNLSTGEYVRIKNPGCSAASLDIASAYFCVDYDGNIYKKIKVFFMGTSPEIDLNKIPKKYHKYFREK